jgi:hypothetical protein
LAEVFICGFASDAHDTRLAEVWENQMKADAESARSLSVLARRGCRIPSGG